MDQDPKDEDARIDPKNDGELERWARKLGVPKDELRLAAERVGPRLGDIKQHLVGGFNAKGPTS